MKVRSGPNARIMSHVVSHYRHAQYQRVGDAGTMPAFGVSRAVREVNVINVAGNGARKSRVLKNNVRRVTYG
jgi:hypothetical protein